MFGQFVFGVTLSVCVINKIARTHIDQTRTVPQHLMEKAMQTSTSAELRIIQNVVNDKHFKAQRQAQYDTHEVNIWYTSCSQQMHLVIPL